MRLKKLFALVCAAVLVLPGAASLRETEASAAVKNTIVDEMEDKKNIPLSGTYSDNIYWATDFSTVDYFGEGGDATGWKLQPWQTNNFYVAGWAEYAVQDVEKVRAEYYWLDNNACLPYIKIDLSHDRLIDDPADYVRSTFAVSEVAGDDVVFKWIDMNTGAVYAKVNGVWFLYCDEVNNEEGTTSGGGYWRWVRTKGVWGYDYPVEENLIPYGGGFQYIVDGTNWTWATPTIESCTINAAGNKNKEVWSADIPLNAIKVRTYLTDRSTYLVAHNPMWDSGGDVRPSFTTRATGVVAWYCGISKVEFDVHEYTPAELGKVLVGYAADGKLYSSAYAAANEGTAFEAVYADFGMKDGASVRIEEPTGIRFRSELVKADYDAIVAYVGTSNVTLGMRVVRGGTHYLDIPATNTVVDLIDSVDHVVFNGVIVNIAAANYKVTYCGTGYVDVTFEDGATERIYAVAGDNTRTIAQVAQAAYEKDNSLTQLKKYFEEEV